MDNEKQISQLLDKYLDGGTTQAEEAALREYFATRGADIPEEWRPYKALFAYIDGERREAAPSARHRGRTAMRIVRIAIAAAAIILALVTITPRARPDNFAIIDGKVYRDRHTVEQEALKALEMVSYDSDDTFGALETLK